MEERTPCPYCENFEASGFIVQGEVKAFNFCPMCGRPYTPQGADMLNRRRKPESYRPDEPPAKTTWI